MKKFISIVLSMFMILSLVSCGNKNTEEPTIIEETEVVEPINEEPIVGGYIEVEDGTITPELNGIFTSAMQGLTGGNYEAQELIATQVVSGTNYKFLAEGTKTTCPITKGTYYIYINEDLQGNISLLDIEVIEEKQEEVNNNNTQNIEDMSFWVVFYDSNNNELQRTIEKYGTTPVYKKALPQGFISWDKELKPITTNTYIHANVYNGGQGIKQIIHDTEYEILAINQVFTISNVLENGKLSVEDDDVVSICGGNSFITNKDGSTIVYYENAYDKYVYDVTVLASDPVNFGTITVNGTTLSQSEVTATYSFNKDTGYLKVLTDGAFNFVFSGMGNSAILDLNGHKITPYSASSPIIKVNNSYELNIIDTNPSVTRTGYIGTDNIWHEGTTLDGKITDYTIKGAILTCEASTINGTAIYGECPVIKMNGGSVAGIKVTESKKAVVCVIDGELDMYSGANIIGCQSSTGGIYLSGNAHGIIDGGKLEYLSGTYLTSYSSGAIYIHNTACLEFNSGRIAHCISLNSVEGGGAIHLNGSSLIINGGTIEDCSTTRNGGAIRRQDGYVTMNGGLIKNCVAAYGGAYNGNSKPFTMNGGVIDGCVGTSGSGAFNSNNVVINGGTIKNCVSYGGGGVVEVSGTLTITGGTFENNSAIYGAVISMEIVCDANISVTGGTYTNNHLSDGTANIYDLETIKPGEGSTIDIEYLKNKQ